MGKQYVGSTGVQVILDCQGCNDAPIDLTTASSLAINVRKPDGSKVVWPATLYGTDSIAYITVAGDFNMAGQYRMQAAVSIGGFTGLGETAIFTVSPLYE
jgi:hypothetical protein